MLFALLRGAIVVAGLSTCFPSSAQATTSLEEANRRATAFVQQTMREQRIPGLQLAVVSQGKVVLLENFGFANVENRVPVTGKTLFPINSATKSITGVAVMQLVQDGRVDLDAPLSRYLDNLPAAWHEVRIRQLLGHTSGLPDLVDAQGALGGLTEREAWAAVEARPIDARPGEAFAYNQTNYGLLSRVIVELTGQPYERFVAERQFAVAGMAASTFGDSYDLVAGAATIYSRSPRGTQAPDDADRLSHWIYEIPYSVWAGGGMQTTAEELAHWIIALSEKRLIDAAHMQGMWQPEALNSGAQGEWALGWSVLKADFPRQVAGIGGARAAFVVYPDEDLAVIVLTNLAGSNPQRFIRRIGEFYQSRPGTTEDSAANL
ncbi:serine hydrolase domain-containing protein [Luteimonas sp. RC10]|uniref:serine hydrolase domain-containing protein n=1 Tax=Luteimonas sp. RC10 TaxID=2587035 RepID=UPI00161B9563|nr:serine hydrolase domain-containing protein [Luteimonas sp. RC10]MBB3344587.1 CubicO group peptidase (beta-lactamase class C family) [Luteimonas sp. RC10]